MRLRRSLRSAPAGALLIAGILLLPLAVARAGSPSDASPGSAPASAAEAAAALDLVPGSALAALGWSGATSLAAPFRATALGEIAAEPRIAEMTAALLPALEAKMREQVREPEEREMLLFLREAIRELWDHPLAIALTGIQLHEGEPVPELVIALGSGAGAERIYSTIESLRQRQGVPAEAWTGAATANKVAIPEAPVVLVYGIERGRLFFAIGEDAARAVVGRIRGEGSSLATAPGFRRAWEPAIGRAVAMDWVYLDSAALRARALEILAGAEATIPPLASALLGDEGLGRLGPVLAVTGIEGKGFRRASYIGWRTAAAPGEFLDEETLALVPGDTSFFSYEDHDLAGCFAALKAFIDGADPEVARQLRGFQALADGFLGFRLEEELLASLGRRFLIFEEPSASGLLPGLCLVIRPADSASMQNCVRRLTASLGALAGMKGISVVARERGGISFVETSGAPMPVAPAWAVRGERLFLALHPTVLEEVFHRLDAPDARERSILASEDFRRARGRIGRDQHGLFYTDTAAAVREIYPYLVPLLQAGVAALGGEVNGLSAMQIPPPHLVHGRLFGDIHGSRRTGDGFLQEAHGPLPLCFPDVGSAAFLVIAAGALSAAAEERSRAVMVEEVHAQRSAEHAAAARGDRVRDVPPPAPAQAVDLDRGLAELLAAIESHRDAAGRYPNRAEAILPHLAADSPARALLSGADPGIIFPAEPIAGPAAPGTLLFHTDIPGPRGERRLGVAGGEIRTADAEALDSAKRLSGWARSARL